MMTLVGEREEAEDLLRTMFADPDAARTRALELEQATHDPLVRSITRQLVGIVLRDQGETSAALGELTSALHLARRSGDRARIADVQASLGGTLATAGRTREALGHLDRAVEASRGRARATVLTRRAWVYVVLLGRYQDAVVDLGPARRVFATAGDAVWEARALNLEGLARCSLGDLAAASRAFERSAEIYRSIGHTGDVAATIHNLGWAAFLAGDLPTALRRYDEAAEMVGLLGQVNVEMVVDRCRAYLAGGMADDAAAVVRETLVARALQPRERADLLLAEAEAALAARERDAARTSADVAARMLTRQERHVLRRRADLTALSARVSTGQGGARLAARAEALVAEMRESRAEELPQTLMLAARLARAAGRAGEADGHLVEAAAFRRDRHGPTRVLGWLAAALAAETRGDGGSVLRACDRGLDSLDQHQATLGSPELRARVAGHGDELAALGTRAALTSGHPRRLLRWSERWRATALSLPRATQSLDPATATDLAALRAHRRRLEEARGAGAPTAALERREAQLEERVRQRRLQAAGSGERRERFDVVRLLDALGEEQGTLVELLEVDGRLYALVVGAGRVRRFDVGPTERALKAGEFAAFTLRQAARARPSRLAPAGERLQEALLGPAVRTLGDGPVVVAPSSRLHGIPWALLPALWSRPISTTPSAQLWLRARSAVPPRPGRRVLIAGPGLASGGAEVPAVAASDPEAVVLTGAEATVDRSLAALDGALLAHVAAHGSFRQDSPLFSSLTLADGPLWVHDLERLVAPPHRVVLSACESGVLQPVGAEELLGLAAALLSMGTAGVVSSLSEVDDRATVEVMLTLHHELRSGAGLAEALLAARSAAGADPVLAATAASFTVLGV